MVSVKATSQNAFAFSCANSLDANSYKLHRYAVSRGFAERYTSLTFDRWRWVCAVLELDALYLATPSGLTPDYPACWVSLRVRLAPSPLCSVWRLSCTLNPTTRVVWPCPDGVTAASRGRLLLSPTLVPLGRHCVLHPLGRISWFTSALGSATQLQHRLGPALALSRPARAGRLWWLNATAAPSGLPSGQTACAVWASHLALRHTTPHRRGGFGLRLCRSF